MFVSFFLAAAGKNIIALGDCPRVPPLVTVVSHVMDGAITMHSVELMNCISCSSRLKSFNAVFCCGIVVLQYIAISEKKIFLHDDMFPYLGGILL